MRVRHVLSVDCGCLGDMSWTMRLQNEPHSLEMTSLADITTLFLPSLNAKSHPDLDTDVSTPQKPLGHGKTQLLARVT